MAKRRRMTVVRKGHKRKSYVKDVLKGKGVRLKRIKGTKVKKAKYTIRDLGAVGRGRKVIPVTGKTALTKYGYSTKKSAEERMEALRKADKAYGSRSVYFKLRAMETMRAPVVAGTKRERTPAQLEAYRVFKADRVAFGKKYMSAKERRAMTAPAVKKWKALPSIIRKRLRR